MNIYKMLFKYALLLVFVTCLLPTLASIKYSTANNQTIIDTPLYVDRLFADTVSVENTFGDAQTIYTGDASALSGFNNSADGWEDLGNFVQPVNRFIYVVIGSKSRIDNTSGLEVSGGDIKVSSGDIFVPISPGFQLAGEQDSIKVGSGFQLSFDDMTVGNSSAGNRHELRMDLTDNKDLVFKVNSDAPVSTGGYNWFLNNDSQAPFLKLDTRGLVLNDFNNIGAQVNGLTIYNSSGTSLGTMQIVGSAKYIGDGSQLSNLNIPPPVNFAANLSCFDGSVIANISGSRPSCGADFCVSQYAILSNGQRQFMPCGSVFDRFQSSPEKANASLHIRCCRSNIIQI